MELTTTQIQEVQQFLNVNQLYYVDLKIEILDHMVLDIEEKMTKELVSFEVALQATKQYWTPLLKETSSFVFGMGFLAPKIVLKKAKRIFWKHYAVHVLVIFLALYPLFFFDNSFSFSIPFYAILLLRIIIVSAVVGFFYLLISKKNTQETTYSFIMNSQSIGLIIGAIVVLSFLRNMVELDLFKCGVFGAYLYSVYSYFIFYKKHQKAIINYKIS